ncbi:hypothetical protein [Nocardia wallacei]|uniref:hypothetical protein n=1 Tax=Nocardia wallacei TaxID=480035 RepID=UPI0024565C62|nr:hypothetical protein [Nocardia wallacei]
MTTTTSENTHSAAAVVPLGFVLLIDDGITTGARAYPDPDSDDLETPYLFVDRAHARNTGARIRDYAADAYGMTVHTEIIPTANYVPTAAKAAPVAVSDDDTADDYPAPDDRVTREYVIRIEPSGVLWRDDVTLATTRPYTAFFDRGAVESAATQVIATAAAHGLRIGATVLAREHVTPVTEWHTAHD